VNRNSDRCYFAGNFRTLKNKIKSKKIKINKIGYTELCKIAVEEIGWALEFVPEQLKTAELCKLIIGNCQEGALEFVPESIKKSIKKSIK
jgi:hypothetical protein